MANTSTHPFRIFWLSGLLSAALGASQYLIVLCTPRAATSEWVNREIRLMQQQNRGDHILAALFEGHAHPRGVMPRLAW